MAGTYDLIGDSAIEQGADLSRKITWSDSAGVPVNLTGYTARMQVRASVGASAVLMELTTENGGIVLGGSAGTIELVRTAAQTAAFTWRRGIYDLELLSPAGKVTRLLKGEVEVDPEVTR